MKSLFAFLTICGALSATPLVLAQEYDCGCKLGAACGHRCPACPKCSNKICTLSVEKSKEERHCYNVECKEICVPMITLPCWTDAIPFFKCKDKSCDSGCGDKCPTKDCCEAPRCGYVKVVKVLKKHEYECDTCGYKWNIETPCNACSQGACLDGACASGGKAAPCDQVPVQSNGGWQTIPPQPAPPTAEYYQGANLRFSK